MFLNQRKHTTTHKINSQHHKKSPFTLFISSFVIFYPFLPSSLLDFVELSSSTLINFSFYLSPIKQDNMFHSALSCQPFVRSLEA